MNWNSKQIYWKSNLAFKTRDEATNCTQMAMGMGMIHAFNNLTQVMTQVFMCVIVNDNEQTTNVTRKPTN